MIRRNPPSCHEMRYRLGGLAETSEQRAPFDERVQIAQVIDGSTGVSFAPGKVRSR
jgi:hypothetical protein